jgi:hypothetical protein
MRYRNGVHRCDQSQALGSLACDDRLRDAAGDELAQHRVEPARHLGPGAAQIPLAHGPHVQDRCKRRPAATAAFRQAASDEAPTAPIAQFGTAGAAQDQAEPGAHTGGAARSIHVQARSPGVTSESAVRQMGKARGKPRSGPVRPGCP